MSDPKTIVSQLVEQFRAEEQRLCSHVSGYTETEARIEFIDRLFDCLGWDMSNARGLPNSLRDVVREESQPTETSAKRPDYTFRVAAVRKFFVEAKKPAVDIRTHRESAFQVRSYGWTAGLPVSILTNFRTLRVYDTRTAPQPGDPPDAALLLEIGYQDLPDQLDELLALFGRGAVANGSIERWVGAGVAGALPINADFLERINGWRLRLAADLHARYPALDLDNLNDLTQKVINRVIFIRMCEDRGLEGEQYLLRAAGRQDFMELRRLFREMDDRYNTGLFDEERDPFRRDYTIDTRLFLSIVQEVYFPQAPYSFAVLDADFLGQVYEQFLVKRLVRQPDGQLALEDKPAYEGREIVTTPQPLVDAVVRRAFAGRLDNMREAGTFTYDALKGLRVLDIAVGSGRFLLRSLDMLIDAAVAYFRSMGDATHIYPRAEDDYRLSFETKRELLSSCLYGIDIDYNAVEVARFSLTVKLLEDENRETLPLGKKILPNLDRNIIWGNSVVEPDFHADAAVMNQTRPLDGDGAGLPDRFDVVVGNPPYVKTEEMKAKTPEEFAYYKARYTTPHKQFDKYFVFIEQAVSRLSPGGWLGMVVSNKWITIEAGRKLRELLAGKGLVAEVVNFGSELLFEGKSTYVCLLVLANSRRDSFWYRHVDSYPAWLVAPADKGFMLPYHLLEQYGPASWILPAAAAEARSLEALFTNSVRLGDIADVINGLQTSAEKVFSVRAWTDLGATIRFDRGGVQWEIEKAITRSYLRDSARVWSYLPVEADALVIFPYEYGPGGEAVLIPPDRLEREYPLTWAYLKAFEASLARRDVSPRPGPGEFYRYGRHQALASAFRAPKIIYSVNQLGDKYGIDLTGVGFASGGTAGEVAILNPRGGYSLEFILALLNQPEMEFYTRKRGSPFRGGYYSRGSAVASDVPVPRLDFANPQHAAAHARITALAQEMVSVVQSSAGAVGRQVEQLTSRRETLASEIRVAFESIWGLTP